jgi:hypothetical protein
LPGDGCDQHCVASQAVGRPKEWLLIIAEKAANGGLLQFGERSPDSRFCGLSGEIVAREGMEPRWTMKIDGTAHELVEAGLSARCARHLGGKRLVLANTGPRPATVFIDESLHGDGFVSMIAEAFEGRRQQAISIQQNLIRVDWKASAEGIKDRRSFDARPKRPSLPEKQRNAPRGLADVATSAQPRSRE